MPDYMNFTSLDEGYRHLRGVGFPGRGRPRDPGTRAAPAQSRRRLRSPRGPRPDSRIMKTRQGYVQGYNAQAVVSEGQIIVAVGVTQEANDVQQLEPMLQTMAHTLAAAGIEDRPKAGLADAGYWSEANIRACSWPEMPELLIATTKDWKHRKMLREKGCPRGRIPKGLSPRDRIAADKARPSSVQEAGCTGGAGVRTGHKGSDGL